MKNLISWTSDVEQQCERDEEERKRQRAGTKQENV